MKYGQESSNYRHGHLLDGKTSSEYRAWQGIKKRCLNEKNKQYKDYGGRGITVCKEWLHSFVTFIEDMGMKPTKTHSIDRIDNNKGYSKLNCRWTDKFTQANNRRIPNTNKTGVLGISIHSDGWQLVRNKMYMGFYKSFDEALFMNEIYNDYINEEFNDES